MPNKTKLDTLVPHQNGSTKFNINNIVVQLENRCNCFIIVIIVTINFGKIIPL